MKRAVHCSDTRKEREPSGRPFSIIHDSRGGEFPNLNEIGYTRLAKKSPKDRFNRRDRHPFFAFFFQAASICPSRGQLLNAAFPFPRIRSQAEWPKF
ncbi:similar to thymidylate kinase [Rhodopirellula baltica SH 1]|uniref:Similar to thymidylate kinase n=1 Tax=Rhodopirellula baltica (strain DSM 10527 / NCIMB 13988 / SH1) TaxID=243090 RepID=Q7UM26_RHOBA|nr:similar to thymidylate kinase [Rhodopirellula baltica SH 1]